MMNCIKGKSVHAINIPNVNKQENTATVKTTIGERLVSLNVGQTMKELFITKQQNGQK
jgi:hypothetical protein